MSKSTFGARLRALRENLTRVELAAQSGIHPITIANLEAGRGDPKWSTACALADALGVSVADFRAEKKSDKKA